MVHMNKHEILDSLRRGLLTRRRFSSLLAGTGLSLVAMPVFDRPARADDQATYFTWSGYDVPESHQGYIAKHGASPNMPLFSDEEEAFQKLRAGFQVDVAHPCSGRIKRWRDAGLLQPIDTSKLSNWGDVFDDLKKVNGADADGQQWFVPWDWGNTSVIYRADLVDITEESWNILWDERYKGKISMGNDITDTAIIAALLVGAADPYDMTDAEIEKVRLLLQKQKPLVRFYWSDSTEFEQAMATGEILVASAWNSSVATLRSQGIDVKYMTPKEGRLNWCCGLILQADAPQPEKAHDLIDAMLDPKTGEWLINYGYGHSNRKTFDLVSDELLAERGFPKDPTAFLQAGVFSKDNARLDDLQTMFEGVKAGI
jgi:spermidine/putrescine transport system substrate-binding protein